MKKLTKKTPPSEVESDDDATLPLVSSLANAAHALKTVIYAGKEPGSCYSPKDGYKNHKTEQIANDANDAANNGACTHCGFDEATHVLGQTLARLGATVFDHVTRTWK